MKYALFGGTFDPVHSAHIELCVACQRKLQLDTIFLMPTAQPPHKLKTEFASADHRLAMCRLVAKDYPWLTVSDKEITRGGASFTYDTLKDLQATYPNDEWYLLMGADMFCTLQTWFQFLEMTKMVTFCTVPRNNFPMEELNTYAQELKKVGAKVEVIEEPISPYSSTEVRQYIQENNPVWKTMVPPAIAHYIENHFLYTGTTPFASPNEQYIEIIKRRLTPYRFEHSLAVAKEAKRLALKYGADADKAYTAGLLHDILKDASQEDKLQIAADLKVSLTPLEKDSPKLWHSILGAAFIEKILGVADKDIVNAVRYHTTARAHMSLLEKVIYVADFTAEGRDYPDVGEMRRQSNISLESGMQYALNYTINDLVKKGRTVHPDTFDAYKEVYGYAWKGSKE